MRLDSKSDVAHTITIYSTYDTIPVSQIYEWHSVANCNKNKSFKSNGSFSLSVTATSVS